MKQIIPLLLVAGLMSAHPAFATDATRIAAVREALIRAPAAEMPACAAALVKATKSRDRGQATVNAVHAALEINPSLAPAVVAAIAKSVPDMASIAAGTAAELEPKLATAIAKAAAVAAPSRAGRIVIAVCRAAPQEYRSVALAVAQAVPGSDREVLEAVSSTFPSLKTGIETALAGNASAPVAAATVLDSSRPSTPPALMPTTPTTGPVAGPGPRGPAIAPPLVPLSSTGTNVNPSTSDPVPRGGRNYAAP